MTTQTASSATVTPPKPLNILGTPYTRYPGDDGYVPVWFLKHESEYGYGHVYAYPSLYNATTDDMRAISFHPASDIRLSCQMSPDFPDSYAWRLETVTGMEARDIYRAAKGMNWLERRYAKLCAELGEPKTFGQYVAYMAKASRITSAIVHGRYAGDWVVLDVSSISHRIDSWITEWHANR